MLLLKILVLILGILLVFTTLESAIRTFVLPRGDNVPLTRLIFRAVAFAFNIGAGKGRTYEERDHVMAMFAPVTLVVIPFVWLIFILAGYAGIYWALGVGSPEYAITLSGSSLLTLGTVPFTRFPITLIEFSEAMLGLGLVALLISYLPTMYSSFSRREALVTMLEVRAGSPPSAVEMIKRMHRIRGLQSQEIHDTWIQWEIWFSDVEESHTSLVAVNFFRSPKPERSWITAAGTILDAAALMASSVDVPNDPQAQLTIRAGYIALRSIADLFRISYHPDPSPDMKISITRDEFDEVWDELQTAGVPMKTDKELAWKNFVGWRVNYDTVLIRLAFLIQAPYAPWISDRSFPKGV